MNHHLVINRTDRHKIGESTVMNDFFYEAECTACGWQTERRFEYEQQVTDEAKSHAMRAILAEDIPTTVTLRRSFRP